MIISDIIDATEQRKFGTRIEAVLSIDVMALPITNLEIGRAGFGKIHIVGCVPDMRHTIANTKAVMGPAKGKAKLVPAVADLASHLIDDLTGRAVEACFKLADVALNQILPESPVV